MCDCLQIIPLGTPWKLQTNKTPPPSPISVIVPHGFGDAAFVQHLAFASITDPNLQSPPPTPHTPSHGNHIGTKTQKLPPLALNEKKTTTTNRTERLRKWIVRPPRSGTGGRRFRPDAVRSGRRPGRGYVGKLSGERFPRAASGSQGNVCSTVLPLLLVSFVFFFFLRLLVCSFFFPTSSQSLSALWIFLCNSCSVGHFNPVHAEGNGRNVQMMGKCCSIIMSMIENIQ